MSRSVFVGNIPYGASQDDLKAIFKDCGTVESFRMVFEKDSGRPKGFGFLTFADRASVELARRNMNGTNFMGRELRVDYAESHKSVDDSGTEKALVDQVSYVTSSLKHQEMLSILAEFQAFAKKNPDAAHRHLIANPALGHAVNFLFDRVAPPSSRGGGAGPPHRNAPPPAAHPPQNSQYPPSHGGGNVAAHNNGYPVAGSADAGYGYAYSAQQQPYSQAAPSSSSSSTPAASSAEKEYIDKLMALSDEQLQSILPQLPPDFRMYILQTRGQSQYRQTAGY